MEAAAGIRPVSADGLPIVRQIDERLIVATGHGRNGIALAPETARRVLDLIGEPAVDETPGGGYTDERSVR